jgi:hypothetical protein
VLAATLLGEPAVAADVHRRLEDIFYLSQSPDDENDDDEGGPPPRQGGRRDEALTNPALAAAFLERLRADATDKRKELYVLMDLARTPLATFQLEALRLAKRPFMIRICSMIARQLGSEQQTLLGLVSDPNSATRANAALVLGILPLTDAQRAQLEKRLAVETERSVRLSIAHALARHGRRERLADIAAGLNPCVGDPCMDALALLASLPRDLRADLDPEVFVAIAGNERQAPHARTLAVEILRHRAITGPLAGRAREALLAASTARDRELSFVATAAIAADASFAREDVLSRLNGPAPAYRALLARLVRVVTPADLALLTSLMPLFADKSPDEAQFVVRAAARIPGKDAEESLLVWFDAYERVRSPIILALTGRRETSPATLQHLAEADEPSKLLVEVATGAPDAIATLERHLRVGAQDRMSAAMVARAVRDPRTREALLQLVTYEDAQYYPSDVLVRHAAISALLAIALR